MIQIQPKISISIPVYKPDPIFFKETLNSILNSGITPDLIEILVVNDSPGDSSVRCVLEQISNKIRYYENDNQLGIAGNWNRCIELSNGEWIHILHQDDIVLPGFYQELLIAQENKQIDAFTARYFIINGKGNITAISHLEQDNVGIFDNASQKIIATHTIQCPSIVVKKEVYNCIGGFNSDLKYVLDWEMWARISLNHIIWYCPKPLVCFRVHSASETPRLKQTGESARDMIKGVKIIASFAPNYEILARNFGVVHIIRTAQDFLTVRQWRAAATQLKLAPICLPSVVFKLNYINCWIWLLKIVTKNFLFYFKKT